MSFKNISWGIGSVMFARIGVGIQKAMACLVSKQPLSEGMIHSRTALTSPVHFNKCMAGKLLPRPHLMNTRPLATANYLLSLSIRAIPY